MPLTRTRICEENEVERAIRNFKIERQIQQKMQQTLPRPSASPISDLEQTAKLSNLTRKYKEMVASQTE